VKPIIFDYSDESESGPYPIPPDPQIEGGVNSPGDRHILVLDGEPGFRGSETDQPSSRTCCLSRGPPFLSFIYLDKKANKNRIA